jgi:hypothetical protein
MSSASKPRRTTILALATTTSSPAVVGGSARACDRRRTARAIDAVGFDHGGFAAGFMREAPQSILFALDTPAAALQRRRP